MSLASLCNMTVDIERKTTTASESGGHVEAFAVVYDDLAATIQPASGRLMAEFERRSMQISHIMYTPTSISLLAGDRVVHGSSKYIVTWFADQAAKGRVFAAYLLKKD